MLPKLVLKPPIVRLSIITPPKVNLAHYHLTIPFPEAHQTNTLGETWKILAKILASASSGDRLLVGKTELLPSVSDR